MNSVSINTVWKCIDENDEMLNRYCVIKYIDDDPNYNGDGTIELIYADGSKHYGKVRRFIPNITHEYIKHTRK
jgi:hypothetical protein